MLTDLITSAVPPLVAPVESLKFALLPKPKVGSADQCFPEPGGRPLQYHGVRIRRLQDLHLPEVVTV